VRRAWFNIILINTEYNKKKWEKMLFGYALEKRESYSEDFESYSDEEGKSN